jgi:hypothetical protein
MGYNGNGGYRGGKPESIELHHIQIGREFEGVRMTRYGDKISLNPYRENQEGKRFTRFCFPRTREGQSEKQYPMGVDLGDPQEAIRSLRQFLHILEKQFSQPQG